LFHQETEHKEVTTHTEVDHKQHKEASVQTEVYIPFMQASTSREQTHLEANDILEGIYYLF
jgi:hypothetical protein